MQGHKPEGGSDENQTWSNTLIDEVEWECENIYSNEVIWSGTLSTGKPREKRETRNYNNRITKWFRLEGTLKIANSNAIFH